MIYLRKPRRVYWHFHASFRDRVSFRFLGVRYAPKPEWFTYPTLYEGTRVEQKAYEYGPACIDTGGAGSEDCLVLNIWTPYLPLKGTAKNLKPVIFNIHGAGVSANEPALDGASLVSRGDVVIVVINYRQISFGWFALDDGVTNGNYAIADRITAFDWVQANIQDYELS